MRFCRSLPTPRRAQRRLRRLRQAERDLQVFRHELQAEAGVVRPRQDIVGQLDVRRVAPPRGAVDASTTTRDPARTPGDSTASHVISNVVAESRLLSALRASPAPTGPRARSSPPAPRAPGRTRLCRLRPARHDRQRPGFGAADAPDTGASTYRTPCAAASAASAATRSAATSSCRSRARPAEARPEDRRRARPAARPRSRAASGRPPPCRSRHPSALRCSPSRPPLERRPGGCRVVPGSDVVAGIHRRPAIGMPMCPNRRSRRRPGARRGPGS